MQSPNNLQNISNQLPATQIFKQSLQTYTSNIRQFQQRLDSPLKGYRRQKATIKNIFKNKTPQQQPKPLPKIAKPQFYLHILDFNCSNTDTLISPGESQISKVQSLTPIPAPEKDENFIPLQNLTLSDFDTSFQDKKQTGDGNHKKKPSKHSSQKRKKSQAKRDDSKKRKNLQENPKAKKIKINYTTAGCDLDIIKEVINKNDWIKSIGFEGDILWTSKSFDQQLAQLYYRFVASRIPGMKELCQKKNSALFISVFQKLYPDQYNFFPKTYILPENLQKFQKDFVSGQTYIAKPDKGCQGRGIQIIDQLSQLDEFHNKNYIIQEYLKSPYLVNRKKFDLRIYVLITSINPLIVYINEEGLARFCTEEYEDSGDITNTYMHLTNYALNKSSKNFIYQPTNFNQENDATKRTFTSLKITLESQGVNVQELKSKIEDTVSKFIFNYYAQPYQFETFRKIYQDRWKQAKCFHILGFDILIDQNLKPWVLEVNASPSLEITQEKYSTQGTKKVFTSKLDLYVKSQVVEDALLLALKSPEDQIKIGKGKLFNSYKLLVDRIPQKMDYFYKLVMIQGELSGQKFGNITLAKFMRLSYHTKQFGWSRGDLEQVYKKCVSRGEDMQLMELYKSMKKLCKCKMDENLEKILNSLKQYKY